MTVSDRRQPLLELIAILIKIRRADYDHVPVKAQKWSAVLLCSFGAANVLVSRTNR